MRKLDTKLLIGAALLLVSTASLVLGTLTATPVRSSALDGNHDVEIIYPSNIFYHGFIPEQSTQAGSMSRAEAAIYIPLLSHDRQVPDVRSPFSVQIAALHQVMPEGAAFAADPGEESAAGLGEASTEGAYSSLQAALKDSGAGWARLRVEWEVIEPNAPLEGQLPEYGWKYYDQALRIVAEAGVRIIATLSDSPTWAASIPCAPIYPERLDEYGRFLSDLVERYKKPPYSIKHWELVNEPDSNRYTTGHLSGHGCWAYDGDQYALMLATASQAIKGADPQATVLMGGIAYDWFEEYGGPFNRYFSDDVMANGGGPLLDALNIHFYTDFSAEWDRWNPESFDRRYDWIPAPTCGIVDDGLGIPYEVEGFDVIAKTSHFRNRMEACYGVSAPVWLTEVGAHGYPEDPGSLVEQARYVIKVYARALSAGVKNITWFSLDHPPYERYEQALLTSDLSPKPSFLAFQTLTREMDGFYTFSDDRNACFWGSAGPACHIEAYVFKDDFQEEKTVAWGDRPLEFAAGQLRLVDRNGIKWTVRDGGKDDLDGEVNGIIKLQLSPEPFFISIR